MGDQHRVALAAQTLAALAHPGGFRFVDRGPHGVVEDGYSLADRGVARDEVGHGLVGGRPA